MILWARWPAFRLIVSLVVLSVAAGTASAVPPGPTATVEAVNNEDNQPKTLWNVEYWRSMSHREKEILVRGFWMAINENLSWEGKAGLDNLPPNYINELDLLFADRDATDAISFDLFSYVRGLATPSQSAPDDSDRDLSPRLYVSEGDYIAFQDWTWNQTDSFIRWSGLVENRTPFHCRPLRASLEFYDDKGRLVGTDRFINYDIRPGIVAVVDGIARVSGKAVSAELRPESCETRY